jgi:hypothetical protein
MHRLDTNNAHNTASSTPWSASPSAGQQQQHRVETSGVRSAVSVCHHHVHAESPLMSGAACWAHTLAQPEVGCVLVARADAAQRLGFFERAVVLITSHGGLRLPREQGRPACC